MESLVDWRSKAVPTLQLGGLELDVSLQASDLACQQLLRLLGFSLRRQLLQVT